jgi:HK97 family phage major capsid protein
MTTQATLTLDVFKRQMLPLLQSRHGRGDALIQAIKHFTEQTTIVDDQGNELDIDTLTLDSAASDSAADQAPSEQRIDQMIQRALARHRPASPRGPMLSHHHTLAPASGFESLGDFALAVHKASQQGGRVDSRLVTKAPTTYANESTGGSGGYMVPTEFADRLWEIVFAPDALLSRTNQIPTSRNSLSLPVSESTPWGASGVQAYWVEEGSAITQSRPSFTYRNLRLHKLAALVPASDELVEDASALDAFVTREAGRAIRYKADDAIINGDGAGKPLGIFNSPALVTVTKETSQTADTVVAANIAKMYARMPASSMGQAVWLLSQDVLPQIVTLTLGDQPIYQPPSNNTAAPLGALLGRPILLSQHCQTLGDKGDIYFVNFSDYITLTRTSGIQSASSIHLWFDHDITAFRFTFRVAGQPWMNEPIAAAHGSHTTSPFVTLEAR